MLSRLDRLEWSVVATSVVSFAFAALSLLYGFALLATVSSALTGVLITIFFNLQVQKREWKRAVTIKMIDELYGPLYVENYHLMQALMDDQRWSRLGISDSKKEWVRVLADYHYLVLQEPLRNNLESFYALVGQVYKQRVEMGRLIDSITMKMKNTQAIFGGKVRSVSWGFQGAAGELNLGYQPLDSFDIIFNGRTLDDVIRQADPRVESYKMWADVQMMGESTVSKREVDLPRAEEYFQHATTELRDHRNYKQYLKDKLDLEALGVQIRRQLRLIVVEPWKA